MSNILLAQQMLEALSNDMKQATPSRHVGHINLRSYSDKFGVTREDIEAYCATLTPLTPVYPACMICGREWSSDRIVQPISNGHIIDFVDSFEMWCSPENGSHDTLWYNQDKTGSCSFDLEMWGMGEPSYLIRWNCQCMVEECRGKNVVLDTDTEDYPILKIFDPPLPFTVSRQELETLLG